VENVFKRVRAEVARQTRNEQVPWEASSLTGDFYFVAPDVVRQRPITRVPAAPPERVVAVPKILLGHGQLALQSRLGGIEVWLDEQRLGETEADRGLVMNNLAPGTYRLKARKAGYKDWAREVQVEPNQRIEVVIDIEPLRGEQPQTARGDDGAEMVLVPSGAFSMGDTPEFPAHKVMLDAFYIDTYEVTNALYRRFRDATGRAAPDSWRDSKFNGPTQPVVGVTWDDADTFCTWAGKRLPSEAEWEKAARGTDGRSYPWGNQWDVRRTNTFHSGVGRTTPVGSYPTGKSPYGAYDMVGNAAEWVTDWYAKDYYRQSPERNPRGPNSGVARVVRGGSWDISTTSPAGRAFKLPDERSDRVGFRCAKSAP
jgi:formylglycine-generating enzyme required for sulfatase activity